MRSNTDRILLPDRERPGIEVTGASCNKGYFSAAITAVLTSFCVNGCLGTTFHLNSGSYCCLPAAIFSALLSPF